MILLDTTTESLEIKLTGAVSSTQLPFTSSYADLNQSTFAITAISSNDGATNNTTAVTMVAAPSASRSRKVAFLNIYNADSASATVTIQINSNATLRILVAVALAVGSTLQYTDGGGWQVLDNSGRILYLNTSETHTLLDGNKHSDTVAQSVSRGSIPYGNSTPKWDELAIGAANRLLRSDGTDVSWAQAAVSTDISGLGASVATALGTAVGSAGAFVVNGGALGTPSSGTLTNATGLPISTGVSGLGSNVATFLATPSSANLAAAVTGETGSGALVFDTAPTLNGLVSINDSANANMTTGLTVNQGAATNEILALKASDINHGMTTQTEADTYGRMRKFHSTTGGLSIEGFLETGAPESGPGLRLLGATDDGATSTRSTTAFAQVIIDAAVKSGTTIGSCGANTNLMAVRDNGTARFFLDSDGDSHQDVGTAWTNFDSHDDVLALNALAVAVSRPDDPYKENIRQYFGGALESMIPPDELQRMGLVSFNADGHHFVNMSKLAMLHTGAIRQLAQRNKELSEEITILKRYLLNAPDRTRT